mgnify:CR=1 FL=1
MNILTLDTATAMEMVAISRNDRVQDETHLADGSHSATLFATIERALKALDLSMKDIELIGVGIGPGSFTGLRIAVTTARMLAQLTGAPLVGLITPLLFAVSITPQEGDFILPAFDARKNRVFGALFRATGNDLSPETVIPPGDYPIETLLRDIPPREKAFIIGDGAEKYYSEISERLPRHELIRGFVPSGKQACRLTKKLYTENSKSYTDFKSIVPYYARKSDAEIMREIRRDGGRG